MLLVREIYILYQNTWEFETSSDAFVYSESAAATSALNNMKELTKNFADNHGHYLRAC